ncbi:MAG: DNA repair protein RecO [Clostridiales bacterium]|nr:DNA repair protein RecO [Clostridiales bacterium]
MSEEKYYDLQAIVLRNRLYKEHDKLVSLFSLERGRLTALARGASRPTGGLRGLTQPFTQVNLCLARGRGSLDVITQGEVERPFISLRQDLDKIAYASYMAELITLAMPEDKPSRGVFSLLLSAFFLLDMDVAPSLASCFFELRLLDALGFAPHLDGCMGCGRGILGGSFALSPAKGGLLCLSCAFDRSAAPLSPGSIMTMRHILREPLSRLPKLKVGAARLQELKQAISPYMDYHLEYAPKAREILKSLL